LRADEVAVGLLPAVAGGDLPGPRLRVGVAIRADHGHVHARRHSTLGEGLPRGEGHQAPHGQGRQATTARPQNLQYVSATAGIDPIGLTRAAVRNVRSGGVVEGGSTLTQQLARTLFLSNSRTYARKAKEAALALMLEEQLTKDQILELYLNRIYLSAGIYGVEAMSRKLFVKRARDLNIAESALIAGLIRAPSALSPWSNVDGAIERSNVVLRRMREEG